MNVLMSIPYKESHPLCVDCGAPVARAVYKVQLPFLHEPSDKFSHWEPINHNCNESKSAKLTDIES